MILVAGYRIGCNLYAHIDSGVVHPLVYYNAVYDKELHIYQFGQSYVTVNVVTQLMKTETSYK